MKMHRILAEASASIVKTVFKEHKVLDHTLAAEFEANRKWGKRDRGFIAETVFEVIRWRRALGFLADSEEANAICAAQWVRMGFEIPDWWKYRGLDADGMRARENDLADQPRMIRESIPDWLDELGVSELGESWDGEIAALNQRAPVYLRVNTLKASKAEVIEWLADSDVLVEAVDGVADALVLPPGKMLPKPLRVDSRIEIQDAGSQMIAPLLNPQPGERIIDTCSGAGGKTLQMAAMMNDEGRIYAMDVDQNKLNELAKRSRRAGVTCIQRRLISNTTTEDFAAMADGLLIDAPCSGLGTLKRQPDLKWRLKPTQLDRVRAIQKDLISRYPAMLKSGGRLVYATCSILPSENRAAVDSLLEAGGFSLVEEKPLNPSQTGFDGFYTAMLRKD